MDELIGFNCFNVLWEKKSYSYVQVGHRKDLMLQFLFWNFNFRKTVPDFVKAVLLKGILKMILRLLTFRIQES